MVPGLCCGMGMKNMLHGVWKWDNAWELKDSVIVPLYKGQGDKGDCKNIEEWVCKGYGRILIDRVRKITDGMIGNEQRGFRPMMPNLFGIEDK